MLNVTTVEGKHPIEILKINLEMKALSINMEKVRWSSFHSLTLSLAKRSQCSSSPSKTVSPHLQIYATEVLEEA